MIFCFAIKVVMDLQNLPYYLFNLHMPNVFQELSGPGSEDAVTPLERRLYFSTAHYHLRAGCPALAVEVLSKLPGKIVETKNDDSIREIQQELD